VSAEPDRTVEGVLLTASLRRVTALPDPDPEFRVPCGSRTVAGLEVVEDVPWDRVTRAVLSPLPASTLRPGEAMELRRVSTAPLWSRPPEVRWLG